MRILIVEDEPKIGSFLVNGFRQEGFGVDHAGTGADGLALARQGLYDAAIIDVMLPEIDGLALVARMRAERIQVPVIFLSARASVDDRIRGLQGGGDDYVTKPFSFSELLARVQVLLRRRSNLDTPAELRAADVVMNLMTRVVTRAGRTIDLQVREFALLECFLRSPGRVLTKTFILERVWDYSFDPQTNVVDVLVCRLRGKIDREFERKLIRTIRGVGYVFKVD